MIFNKITLTAAIIGIAALAFAVWDRNTSPAANGRLKTALLQMGDVTQSVSANGTLNPVVLVNVGTQVSGTVKKLYVDFNDRVKAGQVLLELDPSLPRAQVRQSEANVKSAQASLDLAAANAIRNRDLYAKDSTSKLDLDTSEQVLKSARAQLAQNLAQLEKDKTNLNYATIRSPVSGVVINRQVDLGQTVAASFQTPTLFQIAQDLSKMQIDSSFAEADIGNIKTGQIAVFNVDAFPNHAFDGRVRQVRLNPTIQQNVVTYDVVVAVDNPQQLLMPGMTAYVNVVVAQRKNVLLVPNAALRFKPPESVATAEKAGPREEKRDGFKSMVYVLQERQLQRVHVVTGITDNRFTEIVAGGLNVGDPVVVDDLKASTPVAPSASTVRMRMF